MPPICAWRAERWTSPANPRTSKKPGAVQRRALNFVRNAWELGFDLSSLGLGYLDDFVHDDFHIASGRCSFGCCDLGGGGRCSGARGGLFGLSLRGDLGLALALGLDLRLAIRKSRLALGRPAFGGLRG